MRRAQSKSEADCQRGTPWWSKDNLWRDGCCHYCRREEAHGSSDWNTYLCWELCPAEGLWRGTRNGNPIFHRHHLGTCSLCRPHSRSIQQMDIPGQDHSKHNRPLQTIGKCHPAEIPPFPHRLKCLQKRGEGPNGTICTSWWVGISDLCHQTTIQHNTSEKITAPPVALILQQSHIYSFGAKAEQLKSKNNGRTHRRQLEQTAATEFQRKLPTCLQRTMMAFTEKGTSSWLSALHIEEHGFSLHEGSFRDALSLRYGWRPQHLPSHCVCGHHYSVDHALILATVL